MKVVESIDGILSPKGLFVRGLVLAGVFGVCHLLGLREFTGFLCGTLEAGAGRRELFALLGFVYVILYMLFTVGVPILLLASGMACVFSHFAHHGQAE